MKILYIDDEPELLNLIPCYLDGHHCTLAGDLDSGLDCLKKTRYDLVIVDFLPDLGSLKIIEKCIGLKTEIVLFTGHDDLNSMPLKHVVIKPNMAKLVGIIKEVENEIKK